MALRDGQKVVLAAGALGNAQLLLASAPESGAAVGNENDQVGLYLMEHPHFLDCARIVARPGFVLPKATFSFGDHTSALIPDEALYRSMNGVDMLLLMHPTGPNSKDRVESYLRRKFREDAPALDIAIISEMLPEPDNRVVRAVGTDPYGLPKIHVTCLVGRSTFGAVDTCLSHLGKYLIEEDLGRLSINNDSIFFDLTGGGHIMGTTRMGTDPKTSVVDDDCRVHGYGNLFVAGSSVFPTGGYINPTMTIVALADKLGAKLAKETTL